MSRIISSSEGNAGKKQTKQAERARNNRQSEDSAILDGLSQQEALVF